MSGGKAQARLTHEEVVERFVDYHFGRLTPAMNRAIETHVRSCERCRREGLTRAASDRQSANRKLRSVRGGKPALGPRGRIALLALALVIAGQFVLYQVARGQAQPLMSVFSQWRAQGAAPNVGGAPSQISPYLRLPAGASDASAIALSVNGKLLAVAQGGARPNVTVWSTKSGDRVASYAWSAKDAPASLAWSPDGAMVAASSPSTLMIWTVTPALVVANVPLPSTPVLMTYDLRQKSATAGLPPAQAFANGPLAWGADGALSAAPPGAAGPADVTTPQTPVIGFWSSQGTHLFSERGRVHVGVSPAEAQFGVALLDWSPDGRYLLWAQADLSASGPGASPASALPDSVALTLATRIAAASKRGGAAGEDDALLWFSPDASRVAVCDRTLPNARIAIYAVGSGAVLATLDTGCANLPTHAAQWSADSALFYVAPLSGPVVLYSFSAT
ncbi:MAG TPA: zf-HC2 domain-containing protein [Ktedonobacterales bacterium]